MCYYRSVPKLRGREGVKNPAVEAVITAMDSVHSRICCWGAECHQFPVYEVEQVVRAICCARFYDWKK